MPDYLVCDFCDDGVALILTPKARFACEECLVLGLHWADYPTK